MPDVQGAAAAAADAAAGVQQPAAAAAAAADIGDAGSGKRKVPLQKWVQCADCNKWRQVRKGLIVYLFNALLAELPP
jgi:hypothetical protein